MKTIGHKAILASAGSGKTFRLAHRYIRLLAEKSNAVGPDRICAMTFTRKAAGEIFDSIAHYLREAASDPGAARVTAEERLGMPGLSREDFLRLLRIFIDNLHRCRIGTIDGFIAGVARAFALELGIPAGFRLVESGPETAKEYRRKILAGIFNPGAADRKKSRAFLEAFKQATFGHEERSFGELLDRFLEELQIYYRLCPDAEKWGNEKTIWPVKKPPWKGRLKYDLSRHCSTVSEWTAAQARGNRADGKFFSSLENISSALADYDPESAWDEAFSGRVFDLLMENMNALDAGSVTVEYSRKNYTLPGEVARSLYRLLRHLHVVEFDRALRRTRGLYELLRQYEAAYETVTGSTGNFTFGDIQYLLAGGSDTGRPVISRLNEQSARRLYIDYRMDCRLDHWLFDEFQDTSDLQWAVFENLVDETVQAPPEEGRSLFYVGDVKQAIYRWRGGNNELFHNVFRRFGSVIELESLARTRRCARPVIDAVNNVFGSLPPELLPGQAVAKWKKAWQKHETAQEKAPGCAALLELASSEPGAEGRYMLTADILKEIDPLRRDLSVGILVRKNETGKELVNILRRECPGIHFVHEGESAVVNNEIALALLSLVKAAAHPGDEYAWKYIRMTPMFEVLGRRKINRNNVSRRIMAEINESGFLDFSRKWGQLLLNAVNCGEYGRECLKRFECAAACFDQLGDPDCNSFVRFMTDYTVREEPSGRGVRVMTVHQAKGLEFDIVVLPELQTAGGGKGMSKAETPYLLRAGNPADPDWIIKTPKKAVAGHDLRLREELSKEDNEHCFDSLCLLYVAMTRARHGLYMITSPSPGTAKTLHHSVFLKHQLHGHTTGETETLSGSSGTEYLRLYESENAGREWYRKWPERKPETPRHSPHIPRMAEDYVSRHEKRPLLRHRRPSGEAEHAKNASMLFNAETADKIAFGSAVHELFQRVRWIEDADIEQIVSDWRPLLSYPPDVASDALRQFRKCVNAPDVRKQLSRPAPDASLWLEKSFEIVLGEELISGAFDRVAIIPDESGHPARAAILDYKSSVADTEAVIRNRVGDYTPQMNVYRQALATILNLPQSSIECRLLFTRQAVIREV
ncbi:MAG: UvrD-helicase domain-containing protein [Kiritimatiellia bacterium]